MFTVYESVAREPGVVPDHATTPSTAPWPPRMAPIAAQAGAHTTKHAPEL